MKTLILGVINRLLFAPMKDSDLLPQSKNAAMKEILRRHNASQAEGRQC